MLGSGSVVACVCMLGTGEAESTLGARETVSVHTGMWPRAGCREHHPWGCWPFIALLLLSQKLRSRVYMEGETCGLWGVGSGQGPDPTWWLVGWESRYPHSCNCASGEVHRSGPYCAPLTVRTKSASYHLQKERNDYSSKVWPSQQSEKPWSSGIHHSGSQRHSYLAALWRCHLAGVHVCGSP